MEREELVLGLGELAVRFSEGWHEGIKIDALDIVLLNEAAEALAQPAQEPVAGTKTWFEDGKVVTQYLTAKDIYKEPAQEPCDMGDICIGCSPRNADGSCPSAQPTQEPVAVVVVNQSGGIRMEYQDGSAFDISKHVGQRFYTTPPKRKWVGLTEEEIQPRLNGLPTQSIAVYARSIEAILKEKNT